MSFPPHKIFPRHRFILLFIHSAAADAHAWLRSEAVSLENRLQLLRARSRATSRHMNQTPLRLSAEQGLQLLEPFLRSRLRAQAAAWIYCFLTSPEHKGAFSDRLEELLYRQPGSPLASHQVTRAAEEPAAA